MNIQKISFRHYPLLSLLILIVLSHSCKPQAASQNDESYENYVLLVSFDGFRWDYTDIYDTPNFDEMAREGVRAERLIPSFPTKTFPNHYSIATGLYPDNHGIVNNTFYASDLGLLYRIGDRKMVQNPDFYSGEPIWNTAEKQGVITASYYWVGSEAPVKGQHPSYWKHYDESVAFDTRVDTVISWLQYPLKRRPRFIMLYFHEPDGIGHDFGPVHSKTAKVVEELDKILGMLRSEIEKLPYGDRINLIVTSDHGMGQLSPERYVNISEYVKKEWIIDSYGSNPIYLLDADDSYIDTTVYTLNKVTGITAWKKEDLPARFHYGTNPRISDIVVLADSGWSVGLKGNSSRYRGGTHGYDNANKDMHSIFYAEGPAFKDNYIQPPFENVNLYALIAHILGLEAAKTDGSLDQIEGMIR